MSIFERIWKSVSHGEETVKDHLKYELGVPIGFEWGMKAIPVFKVWIFLICSSNWWFQLSNPY